jgi:exosortase
LNSILAQGRAVSPPVPRARLSALLVFTTLAFLWFILCRQLSIEWTYNDQYSYGWFVPFFALYIFWLRWEDRPNPGGTSSVSSQNNERRGRHRDRPSRIVAVIALLILFPVRVFEIANPGWRLLDWLHASAVAILMLLAIYWVGGKLWLRHFAFPIGFFFVALPWFSGIEEPVIQGLMRGVAAIVSELLNLLGLPAQLEGSVIRVNTGIVGVNEACSGVRSLQTSLMIGLLFGELHRLTTARRLALIVATIVLALTANVGRTLFLVSVAATRGLAAMEHEHDIAGYGVLLIVFIGALAIAALLGRQNRRELRAGRPKSPSADAVAFPVQTRNPFGTPLLLGTLVWLIVVEVGAEAWYRWHERNLIPQAQWTVRWPEARPGFHEIPLDERTRRLLRFNEGRGVIWRDDQSVQSASGLSSCLLYFFRWQPGHNSALLASLHRPDVCLPAVGWRQTADHGVHYYPIAPGLSVPFRHFEFLHHIAEGREQFAHAFYCLWEDRVRRIGNSTSNDEEMRRGPSEWTRSERMQIVLEGRRHLGQQVMEFVIAGSQPMNPAEAEARFASTLKELIIAPR